MREQFETKSASQLQQQIDKSVLNKNTGELENHSSVKVFKAKQVNEENYFKIYLNDLQRFNSLTKAEENIFRSLLTIAEYETGVCFLNGAIRCKLSNFAECKEAHFNNTLSKLLKLQLIIKIETNVVALNPFYVASGSWSNIKKLRDMIDIRPTAPQYEILPNTAANFDCSKFVAYVRSTLSLDEAPSGGHINRSSNMSKSIKSDLSKRKTRSAFRRLFKFLKR